MFEKIVLEYARDPNVATAAVFRDFYMDDFLDGAATVEEAIKLRNGLITMMSSAGTELDKWSSNDIIILDGVKITTIQYRFT